MNDCEMEDMWASKYFAIKAERDALREALDTLYAVVGLTAFKHEAQRAVLQEAMDQACAALAQGEVGNDN